jgi:AbrB family transcriptional regulator (stage V sporulation protein T)
MRATGIVRRIDDLGRVVVPKEIRRILKIREGDPLEIYTDNDGGVILKKYSPIGELAVFAREYAEALAGVSGYKVIITDRDRIIATAGGVKKEYQGKNITSGLEEVMSERDMIFNAGKGIDIVEQYDYADRGQVICPITSEGDIIGAVVLAGKEAGSQLKDTDRRLAAVAASFLGKQMENY